MKSWSNELIELTKQYLKYDGVSVKSLKGNFGIINKYEDKYIISIKPDYTVNLTFYSIDEIINAGWAVD